MSEDTVAVPTITAAELQTRLDDGQTFVLDFRMKSSGDQISSARQYDPKQVSAADPLILPIPHDGTTVLVDERGDGKSLRDVIAALSKAKYVDLRLLEGGFEGWSAAELPVVEVSVKQPVPGAAEHQLFR